MVVIGAEFHALSNDTNIEGFIDQKEGILLEKPAFPVSLTVILANIRFCYHYIAYFLFIRR